MSLSINFDYFKMITVLIAVLTALPTEAGDKGRKERKKVRFRERIASRLIGDVKVPLIARPKTANTIPEGSRIVIGEISGLCSEMVADALLQRLAENVKYEVLTREYLKYILEEHEDNWSGDFNTQAISETGELLGASVFIFGRVGYCKSSVDVDIKFKKRPIANEVEGRISVTLQAVDATTGEVIVSSGHEGSHTTRESFLASDVQRLEYSMFMAAKDVAGQFADKALSRPEFLSAEMFGGPAWRFGKSADLVRLGRCPMAVSYLRHVIAPDLPHMSDVEVAKFLHNYGVALMCANLPEEAMRKLRSSYRVIESKVTLKMLDMSSSIVERDLFVEVDVEPEMDMLMERVTSPDDRK